MSNPDEIFTGAAALSQIANRQALVVPYAARVRQLAERLGQNFDATIQTFDHLPLAQNGEQHRVSRAKAAQFLGPGRARLKRELPSLVARHFSPLETSKTLEVMVEIIIPFVDDCLTIVSEVAGDFEADSMVSRLFSQSAGVAKRRRLNRELIALRLRVEDKCPHAEANDIRLALMILGRDALIGTLAGSLAFFFEHLDGRQLSAETFSDTPTRTGVPYIDRVMADGKTVRCQLSDLSGNKRTGFFGKGIHACLGRAISADIFAEVSEFLSLVDRSVSIQNYRLRKDDVFDFPEFFEIELWTKE